MLIILAKFFISHTYNRQRTLKPRFYDTLSKRLSHYLTFLKFRKFQPTSAMTQTWTSNFITETNQKLNSKELDYLRKNKIFLVND